MSSSRTAFGRSLPRDLIASPSSSPTEVLRRAGESTLNATSSTPKQLWKQNDEKACKNGSCQSVYWVRSRRPEHDSIISRRTDSSTSSSSSKQWVTSTIYKGEWSSNHKHGYGLQIYSNGSKYEGEWYEGMRHGHGVEWKRVRNEKGEGKGDEVGEEEEEEKTMTNGSNSNRIRPISTSSATSASSSSRTSSSSSSASSSTRLRRVYAGNWSRDVKHGMGVYYYVSGARYEGEWVDGVRSGRGTLYYTNGDVYTGEWASNTQNGFGTLTKTNSDVYEGEWVNGRREGAGIYYYAERQKIYDGEWVNDQPKCGVYLEASEFFAKGEGEMGDESGREEGEMAMNDRPLRNRRRPMPIPRLRLAEPDRVLADAIESIAYERAAVRSLPHTKLSDLYTEEVIDTFRGVFARYDADASTGDGSGMVHVKHLPAMLHELGLVQPSHASSQATHIDESTSNVIIPSSSSSQPSNAPSSAELMSPTQLARLCADLRKSTSSSSTSSSQTRVSFIDFVRAIHLCEEENAVRQQRDETEADAGVE